MEPNLHPGLAQPGEAAGLSGVDGASLSVRVTRRISESFGLQADFGVPPGITILFGASGSGKTTLLHCVAGLVQPHVGRITLGTRVLFDSELGIDVGARHRGVGYLFQTLALFPHLTAGQNIQYGLSKLDSESRRRRTNEIAESFRIGHLLSRKPGEISGGERQRVALARSLVTQPESLLLDEPLAGLDGNVKSKIVEDVRAWNAARGIPIIYVTHASQEVFALGERVVVLDAGRIIAQGTPQQVLDAPRREEVAQLAGFENILEAGVVTLRESNGTMICRLNESKVELEVPMTRAIPGSRLRIAVRAGDIILATKSLDGLSARNQFPGKLISLQQHGVTVIASVESGVKFEVHLTPGACEELQLRTGQQVWIVLKSYSCHPVS